MFEISVPSPVNTLEAFVHEDEEYPIVCFGIKEGLVYLRAYVYHYASSTIYLFITTNWLCPKGDQVTLYKQTTSI